MARGYDGGHEAARFSVGRGNWIEKLLTMSFETPNQNWNEQRGAVFKMSFGVAFLALATMGADSVLSQDETSKDDESDWVVHAVALSPDLRLAPFGHMYEEQSGSSLHLRDGNTGKDVWKLEVRGPIRRVAFSLDGKTLVTIDDGDRLLVRNVEDGQILKEIKLDHKGWPQALAISPDGKLAVTGANDVACWELATGTSRWRSTTPSTVMTLAFSPDGTLVATGNSGGELRLLEVAKGKERQAWKIGPSMTLEFSGDGKYLAVGGFYRGDDPKQGAPVSLWESETGKSLRVLTGHTKTVAALAFSPEGNRLISGGWDRTLRLWDLPSGKASHHIDVDRAIGAVRFQAQGAVAVDYRGNVIRIRK